MAFVYWIHLPEHTDMLSQGYIGVTTGTVNDRFSQHKHTTSKGSNLTVHNAIRKHGAALIVKTLVSADEDYCYELESKLRPHRRTGWNIVVGGGKSPLSGIPTEEHPCYGKPCSASTKAKISEANKGAKNGMSKCVGELNHFFGKKHSEDTLAKMRTKKISEEQKQANREKMLAYRDWERPTAVFTTWINAQDYYEDYLNGISPHINAKTRGIGETRLITIYKRFKSGWKPSQDPAYMAWYDDNRHKKELHEGALTA